MMNIKITPLLAILLFCSGFLHAQGLGWVGQTGSTDYDAGQAIAVDAAGNSYHTGYFQGTVDFDPGTGTLPITCVSDEDIYVAKWDWTGGLVWVRTIGSPGMDFSQDIELDGEGNVLVVGSFSGTTDFDPGPGTFMMDCEGASDGFVLKLDNDGNFIWALQIEGPLTQYVHGVGLDGLNNVYVSGGFFGNTDFDPSAGFDTLNTVSYEDAFVARYTSDGGLSWVKAFAGFGSSQFRNIAVSEDGKTLSGGFFSDTLDADPGPDSLILHATSMDAFLASIDASGDLIWAGSVGMEDWDQVEAVGWDGQGNAYAVGFVGDTCDFDLGPGEFWIPHTGGRAGFIASYDTTGTLRWAHLTGASELNGVAVSDLLGVTVTGIFGDTIDCDPGAGSYVLSAVGQSDILFSQFSQAGEFQWAAACGGTSTDVGQDIALNDGGTVFATGYFWGTCDFDPEANDFFLSSAGVRDVFVMRLDGPAAVENAQPLVQVRAYPNPAWETVRISSSSPVLRVTAFNSLGAQVGSWESDGFSVHGLSPGIYLLRVETVSGQATVRVQVR
jgi:hypothetical protein